MLLMRNVDLTLKNLDHPLDKIFGNIPAGSSAFTHVSVMHYPSTTSNGMLFKTWENTNDIDGHKNIF
jgi:hypothetical protein